MWPTQIKLTNKARGRTLWINIALNQARHLTCAVMLGEKEVTVQEVAIARPFSEDSLSATIEYDLLKMGKERP